MDDIGANIVGYVRQSLEVEEEFHFLRFEFLQRLNITQIQLDLIRLKSEIDRDNYLSVDNRVALQTRLGDYGRLQVSMRELPFGD
jgi:hypothetical protein